MVHKRYDTHRDIDAPFPGVNMCVIQLTAALFTHIQSLEKLVVNSLLHIE